jgi:hypothetical protein
MFNNGMAEAFDTSICHETATMHLAHGILNFSYVHTIDPSDAVSLTCNAQDPFFRRYAVQLHAYMRAVPYMLRNTARTPRPPYMERNTTASLTKCTCLRSFFEDVASSGPTVGDDGRPLHNPHVIRVDVLEVAGAEDTPWSMQETQQNGHTACLAR